MVTLKITTIEILFLDLRTLSPVHQNNHNSFANFTVPSTLAKVTNSYSSLQRKISRLSSWYQSNTFWFSFHIII